MISLVGAVWVFHGLRTPSAPREVKEVQALPSKFRAGTGWSRPRTSEVVRMQPEEWLTRFEKEAGAIDPQVREDITRLSGEMQALVENGSDPRGEDVRIYAEAILALLDSRDEP